MRKHHKTLFFALFFLVGIGSVITTQNVYADGGQVTTNGVVGFYEESSAETINSTSSEAPKLTETSQLPKKVSAKPKGRLPSTGELIQRPLIWVGILIVAGIVILFLRVMKKKLGKEDK